MRWGVLFGVLALSCGVVSCSDPGKPRSEGTPVPVAEGFKAISNERISAFRPKGVTFGGIVDDVGDGKLVKSHKRYWDFVAPNEASLISAANELYAAAIADGWSGDRFLGPGEAGIDAVELVKGELALRITYVTEKYFPSWSGDDDVLKLSAEIDAPLYQAAN